MKHKILALLFLSLSFAVGLSAQTHYPVYNPAIKYPAPGADTDSFENLVARWDTGLNQVRQQVNASIQDFEVFTNFYQTYIDSSRYAMVLQIESGKIDSSNIASYMNGQKQTLQTMYGNFINIQNAPNNALLAPNMAPAVNTPPVCNPACTNMDFSDGNFTGWYGYYGTNASTTNYKITGVTGGALGASQKGAQSSPGDYQIHLTSAAHNDWFLSNFHNINMSQASPWGSGYSAMIGDSVNKGGIVAILSQRFQVTATTNSITYAYSVFLENPGHTYWEQPFFSVILLDQNGDTIKNCGEYDVVSQAGLDGFQGEYYSPRTDTIYWKNWTQVNVPLDKYVGQCVTIQFEVSDCEPSGHCGYAYVDASCGQLAITASAPAICGKTGSLDLYGPVGESRYLWSGPGVVTNDTLQNVTIDSAGKYMLVITPVTGGLCNDTLYYTVLLDTINLTATPTNVACNGGKGSILATQLNGLAPFAYAWTPSGGTNANATGLAPGSYSVTVTDKNGCSATASAMVTQPTILTATISGSANLLCGGGNTGSATVTAGGGTAPYTYLWTPGGKTNANITGLTAGSYTATVTDANGCTATVSITLTQPVALTANVSALNINNVLCNGGTGSATVTAVGGTLPYTYAWTPSGGTNATGTGLTAGSYTVTVTDNNGCTASTSVALIQPTLVTATIGAVNNVPCNGGVGNATVNAAGGTPAYAYLWTPVGGTNVTGTGLSVGTYTVTVKDNHGCTASTSVAISQPPVLAVTISANSHKVCRGSNNGNAQANPIGGTPGYSYLWTNGSTKNTSGPISAGTYTVTVTDANGCTGTASITLTQPAALAAAIGSATNILCNGGTNGSAMVTVSGGTPAYTYLWTPGGSTNATATGLTAGNYNVTVTDSCGNNVVVNVTITQPSLVTATMSAPVNVLCNGENNGSTMVTAGGGTPGYSYLWAPGGSTNASETGLIAGTYTVTITDNNGCTATASTTVTQPATLIATIGAPLNVSCNGGTGTATVGVVGGTLPYAYFWTPSGGNNATGTGLTAGIYTVTVTDNHGCTATVSVTITQPLTLTATMGVPNNILCNGGLGSATVTANGGTPAYAYLWAPMGGNNATGTGLAPGVYTVTVTDTHGCTATANVTITQPALLTANVNALNINNVFCNGGSNGSATVTVNGGTPNYTYLWTPAGGTNALGTGLTAGSYTVTVTDNHGCIATAGVTITQALPLTANVNAGNINNVLCNGGTGNATVTAIGGTLPYTYLWSPVGGTNATGTGLAAGSYTATVTDNNGCSVSTSVTITQPTVLAATISSISNILCNGGTGTATVTANGGTPNYAYLWAPSGGTNATATGLLPGSYTVTVTDNNGCSVTATAVTITQPTLLTATINAINVNNVLCNGGTGNATVTVNGGTPNYAYLWTPSGGTNAIGTGLTAGSYTVTVTDNHGCTATAGVTITQASQLTANVNALNVNNVLCNGGTGDATVTAAGGSLPYTYLWSPIGGTNATGTGLAAGSYTATVTDNNGCSVSTSVTITQPTVLAATISSISNVLCNGGTGTATVTANGGTPNYAYLWAPSGGTNAIGTGLTAGSYTVTVTDNHACTTTATVTITQASPLVANVNAININNVLCNGGIGNATVTAVGGTLPYTYSWTPSGGTSAMGTGLTAGSYTAKVTDNNGCSATTTIAITQPTVLSATMGAPNNVPCNGGMGSAVVTAGGGTPPYNYSWSPIGGQSAVGSNLMAGSYTATVKDADGCTATANVTITQPGTLATSLTPTNISCYQANNGKIIANVIGGTAPYTYNWSDGQTNGIATSLASGKYSVTVKDANGCNTSASVTLTEPTLLTVTESGPTSDCSGAPITIVANASGGTPPYKYSWSPAGGTNATTVVNPISKTTYTITVTDANGCSATADNLTVILSAPLTLVVTGDTVVCPGQSVMLRAMGSGGDGNYNYLWVPSNQTTQSVSFVPTRDTVVTVELSDGCGSNKAIVNVPINYNSFPDLSFTADIMRGCAPLCVQFRQSGSTKGVAQWTWNFGNGDSVSEQSPINCYKDSGLYSVSLTAVSKAGCSKTLKIVNMIDVFPLPKPNFTYSTANILSPEVQFADQTTGKYPIVQRYWRLGEGDSTSSLLDPTHYYHDTGMFCPTLTVMDMHGCVDSITNCLNISPLYTLYVPDAFTPNGDGINDFFMPKGTYIKDYEMFVFDRWGMKLFHSTNINNGWDGNVGGSTAQEDVYIYKINVTDTEGNEHAYSGRVTLIR